MKGLDHMFCASQASTAVRSSMDHIDKSSIATATTAVQLGGRAIDRHNPIIKDGRRSFSTPCSSLQPISPKPMYHQLQKTKTPQAVDGNNRKTKKDQKNQKQDEPKRKGSATSSLFRLLGDDISFARKSFGCANPVGGIIRTPPGSSRYLLGEPDLINGSSDYDPVFDVVNKDVKSVIASKPDAASISKKKPSSDQVVVLRVSLHCKGCEGKVRKHLSRMQGVTSFDIDFAAKKVTVTGKVTQSEVLASISKVKNAQIWTNPPSLRANPGSKN